jgi:hypothetical protein
MRGEQNPKMGVTIEAIGDIDKNGMPDFALHAIKGNSFGKLITVLVGIDDGVEDNEGKVIDARDYFSDDNPSLAQPERYATEMAKIGDVDGDNIPDFATSSPLRDTDGVINAGAVYINFLNDDGTVRDVKRIDSSDPRIDLPI